MFFLSWIIENSSYHTEIIQKEMYVSGTDEAKWRERHSSTPCYLHCSIHPSFLSILASSIFIGLQRRSIWIDVRNEILLGSRALVIFLKHQHSKNQKAARIVNINFSVLLLFINHYLDHSCRTNWYYTSERCKKLLIC